MTPCFPDDFIQMPTLTWTGGEYIPDCDKSTVQVQPSVESCSNASASHYEIMTASRDKSSHMYGLGSDELILFLDKMHFFPTIDFLPTFSQ